MSEHNIRYAAELWNGKEWVLETTPTKPLRLNEEGDVPLSIMDEAYGLLRFDRAEALTLFMIPSKRIVIVYRGMRPIGDE